MSARRRRSPKEVGQWAAKGFAAEVKGLLLKHFASDYAGVEALRDLDKLSNHKALDGSRLREVSVGYQKAVPGGGQP